MSAKLYKFWDNLEEYLCCVLLAVIVTLLMIQVLFRYVGGHSIAWSEEVCRFTFLYLVYFAASLATHKNAHIRVTAQLKLLPRFMQILLLFITDVIWLTFALIVLYVGTEFIIGMSRRPMISGALMLDMRYINAAVPLAFALQAIRVIERWARILLGRDKIVIPSEEVS
ncbi:MAG: TRAP transporter small permease [Desulfovibrionaceae bacterium]|nr:TRAP transporter small permease [Desulfovibrionaceae bacterium]